MALVSVADAAALVGVNRTTVQRWIKAGLVRQTPKGRVDLDQVARVADRPRARSRDPLVQLLLRAAVVNADAAAGVDIPTASGPRPALGGVRPQGLT